MIPSGTGWKSRICSCRSLSFLNSLKRRFTYAAMLLVTVNLFTSVFGRMSKKSEFFTTLFDFFAFFAEDLLLLLEESSDDDEWNRFLRFFRRDSSSEADGVEESELPSSSRAGNDRDPGVQLRRGDPLGKSNRGVTSGVPCRLRAWTLSR